MEAMSKIRQSTHEANTRTTGKVFQSHSFPDTYRNVQLKPLCSLLNASQHTLATRVLFSQCLAMLHFIYKRRSAANIAFGKQASKHTLFSRSRVGARFATHLEQREQCIQPDIRHPIVSLIIGMNAVGDHTGRHSIIHINILDMSATSHLGLYNRRNRLIISGQFRVENRAMWKRYNLRDDESSVRQGARDLIN